VTLAAFFILDVTTTDAFEWCSFARGRYVDEMKRPRTIQITEITFAGTL